MKYINSEKLIAEIEKLKKSIDECPFIEAEFGAEMRREGKTQTYNELLSLITSLLQDQPIEGKQVVIITETDGDANIHWDCRSLDDVKALLASAQSFIADKQVEESRGIGSGPDYNTTEGRFRNAYKFHQEQPVVDLEKEIDDWYNTMGIPVTADALKETARHFYELGLNARKEK